MDSPPQVKFHHRLPLCPLERNLTFRPSIIRMLLPESSRRCYPLHPLLNSHGNHRSLAGLILRCLEPSRISRSTPPFSTTRSLGRNLHLTTILAEPKQTNPLDPMKVLRTLRPRVERQQVERGMGSKPSTRKLRGGEQRILDKGLTLVCSIRQRDRCSSSTFQAFLKSLSGTTPSVITHSPLIMNFRSLVMREMKVRSASSLTRWPR